MIKWKRFSEEEINQLKQGIIPEGRSYQAYYLKALRLGVKDKFKKGWKKEEIEILKKGEVPNNRSPIAAYLKALNLCLNLDVIEKLTKKRGTYILAKKNMTSKINHWTKEEIEILKKGEVPEKRTACAAYKKAIEMNISQEVLILLSRKRTMERRKNK